jgi:Lrp/AsnC family transcriptional regulator, leucine-responsive regulatory protein
MTKRIKLDKKDRQILAILQKQGRITNAQLAIEVGLSPAPTLERVKKLENLGIIESYHARLSHDAIGLGVTTLVKISLNSHSKQAIERFAKEIDKIDEVIECHHTTGTSDFILKVVAKDIPAYQELMLEHITEIMEINDIESMVILSTLKDTHVVPIP